MVKTFSLQDPDNWAWELILASKKGVAVIRTSGEHVKLFEMEPKGEGLFTFTNLMWMDVSIFDFADAGTTTFIFTHAGKAVTLEQDTEYISVLRDWLSEHDQTDIIGFSLSHRRRIYIPNQDFGDFELLSYE